MALSIRTVALSCLGSLILGAGPTPAHAEDDDSDALKLQERPPLAFLLITPTGAMAQVRTSEIIRDVTDNLKRHTNFFPQLLEPSSVETCRGRLGCISEAIREDYVYEALVLEDGSRMTYAHFLKRLTLNQVVYPRYLLLISNIAQEGAADRMTILLLDTDAALNILHHSNREQPDWRDAAEDEISEQAVLFGPKRTRVQSTRDSADFIRAVFVDELQKIFEATDNWEPWGSIAIQTEEGGHEVLVDGKSVGTTKTGITRIIHVLPGVRNVRLRHPGYEDAEQEVEVLRNKQTDAQIELVSKSGWSVTLRDGVTWGGVAVAAAGAALVVMAIARADGDVVSYCFEGSPGCESGQTFQRLDYDADKAAEFDANVNGSGLLVAPLGYSLLLGGATWALGTMFYGDDGDYPWLQFVTGLAVGALSYGLSAALNPSDGLGP